MSRLTKLYFFSLGWWVLTTVFWYWIMTHPQVGWTPGVESMERAAAIMMAPSLVIYMMNGWGEWFGEKGQNEKASQDVT